MGMKFPTQFYGSKVESIFSRNEAQKGHPTFSREQKKPTDPLQYLVKLARDLTQPISPMVVKSKGNPVFLGGILGW